MEMNIHLVLLLMSQRLITGDEQMNRVRDIGSRVLNHVLNQETHLRVSSFVRQVDKRSRIRPITAIATDRIS
jgi:hypothetical protein